MANENQQQKNLQETAESLKIAQQNLAAGQNAVNQSFKESINLLNKINNIITDSTSKTASFEKSTINIKRIQTEQERIERRRKTLDDQINQANQADVQIAKQYITNIEQRRKIEEDIIKKRATGNYQQARALTQQLQTLESTIQAEEQRLNQNTEQLALVSKIKSAEALKERVDLIGKELDVEKKIKDQLGYTGIALKVLNKYLLFGKDTYGKMVEEAREGDKTTKKWVANVAILSAAVYGAYKAMKAFADVAKTGLDSLTQSGGPVSKFVSPFTNLIKQIPVLGGLLGGLVDAGANIIDFATGATSKIEDFARNLGISFSQAKGINQQFDQIARNSGQAFLTVEKLTNSQLELSKALGINNILNESILKDNLQLQEQLGLELETRKQLAQITLISDVSQTKIFKTIVGQVEAIRRSIGVNLRVQDVIAKISQISGVVGLTFAKYPERLAKSLAITKALGLDFQKLDSIASGLLDFESSIAAEFEAQLLTGKDINLGKARQLALDNDLTGLAVELNKQLGSSQEFINMNRISQESYAKALGMSRDEIADMLRQQEMFAAAGVTDLKTFKMRVAEMERAGTLQSEFLNKLGEEQAQLFLNSTATEKIANFFDKIKQSFATLLSSETFKSFIDTFLNKLADPNFITGIINKLSTFVSLLLNAVAAIVDAADVVANALSFGRIDISNDIPNKIRSYANSLGNISLGGKVAASQISTSGGGATVSGTAAGINTPQAISLTVQTVVDDHARKAEQRISMAPKADYTTGPYGKK
jgi:hypothetical protein